MGYELFSFVLLVLFAAAAVLLYDRRYGDMVARLLLVVPSMRLLGAVTRYEFVFRYYDGPGDAVRYYDGMELTRQLWSFAISPLSLDYWMLESARSRDKSQHWPPSG